MWCKHDMSHDTIWPAMKKFTEMEKSIYWKILKQPHMPPHINDLKGLQNINPHMSSQYFSFLFLLTTLRLSRKPGISLSSALSPRRDANSQSIASYEAYAIFYRKQYFHVPLTSEKSQEYSNGRSETFCVCKRTLLQSLGRKPTSSTQSG